MFELSLLIFVIACCHVCYKLAMRLLCRQQSPVPFFIPSERNLNLVWGFAFYAAAFGLLSHSAAHRTVFGILAAVLFTGALLLHFYRSFFCGGFCPTSCICKKILQNRLRGLPIQSAAISPREAAALLGLRFETLRRETLDNRYKIITCVLEKRCFLPPELQTLLTKAYNILANTLKEE